MPQAIAAVNDFVVKFANVNGSGSASANELFARSILRMGVPVSPRNIFPSNIQGLPTWYEVRVTEKGYLGRRGGGVDMMVAMNPQTWAEDVKEIEPGGYLFYDSTKPMPSSMFREDINVIGVPLTAITNATYSDPRQRQLFKNIIYVGALSVLLDPGFRAAAEKGLAITLADYARAFEAKSQLARDMALWHEKYDLLLAPVAPTAAPQVETLYNSEAFPRWTKGAPYTLPCNLTGQPAASMPAGLTASGLPVGLQIIGPPRADHLVLRAMRALESASGWTWPQAGVLETLARL